MIESVQLQNFISHGDTALKLDNGLTIFIGHNGSGKSSVIDAITFALYGQHNRKSNKNLVKRGANSALVEVEMSVRGRRFKIVRALNSAGQLVNARLVEYKQDREVDIVSGERKQFAESVAEEVSKILGLDYSKLSVAAVVQQGELNSIIQAQPKEFKELINSLFGLDRLDLAFDSMREVMQYFRTELRKKVGYDDSEISNVEEQLQEARKVCRETQSVLIGLEEEKKYLQNKISGLENSIKEQEPLHVKLTELESTRMALLNYVKKKKKEIESEVSEGTELVNNATKYLLIVKDKHGLEEKLEEVREALSSIDEKLENTSSEIGRIEALIEVGSKLQVIDGKCPICKSPVAKIESFLNVDHLEDDLKKKKKELENLTEEKHSLRAKEKEYRKKELEISNAESFLTSNNIRGVDDIKALEKEILESKYTLLSIPSELDTMQEVEKLAIDDFSKDLAMKILSLLKETKNFDDAKYEQMKNERKELVGKQLELEERIGEYKAKFEQAENESKELEIAINELEKAGTFVKLLETIRNSVYNRDGTVGMSLRTWALKTISKKASEYTAMFNMSISRLELTEKARSISIECYGRSGAIDMESLSGGEKVAIALALRLGIAYVMGSGRLDFVILDEPTTHLDEERRKSLVRIITEAFRSGLGPLSQMILITHDSEIFENAEVDSIYKFSMTNEGTLVTKL
jgi:exonuclease SbcC